MNHFSPICVIYKHLRIKSFFPFPLFCFRYFKNIILRWWVRHFKPCPSKICIYSIVWTVAFTAMCNVSFKVYCDINHIIMMSASFSYLKDLSNNYFWLHLYNVVQRLFLFNLSKTEVYKSPQNVHCDKISLRVLSASGFFPVCQRGVTKINLVVSYIEDTSMLFSTPTIRLAVWRQQE